jgi:hypothetical protein
MAAVIQIKRKITGTAAAPPASANDGELFFAVPGFTGGGPNSLWIDNGTALIKLVDNTRQVELAGAQTITGVKTFSTVANLAISDGTSGQILQKGAGAALVWGSAPAATVTTDGVTIDGNGSVGTPIKLDTAIFGTGMTWSPNKVNVNQATQTVFGGGMVATSAEVDAGVLDTDFVTPLGLRFIIGAATTALITDQKTVIPAINEVQRELVALAGILILAGAYDAAMDEVTPSAAGEEAGLVLGPLPAASPDNSGWYMIIYVAGMGTGNAPAVALEPKDWLVSDGLAWVHIPSAMGNITAGEVILLPNVNGWTNVQQAIEGAWNSGVIHDTSLAGNGNATPLAVAIVDGGAF